MSGPFDDCPCCNAMFSVGDRVRPRYPEYWGNGTGTVVGFEGSSLIIEPDPGSDIHGTLRPKDTAHVACWESAK